MKNWSWGRDTYKADDDDDVVMEMGKMETVNPAYVPDDEDPSSYQTSEKGCQFPEKPRKRSKKTGSGKRDKRPEDQVRVQDPGSEQGSVASGGEESDGEGIDL